jgi:hypothetical protein
MYLLIEVLSFRPVSRSQSLRSTGEAEDVGEKQEAIKRGCRGSIHAGAGRAKG